MSRLIFDVETDNLLDKLTKVHCMAIRDVDTDQTWSFVDQRQSKTYPPLADGLAMLDAADLTVAHNGIGFDAPALKKVLNYTFPKRERLFDTMIMSQVLCKNLKDRDMNEFNRGRFPGHLLMKPHSLEAWGIRLGNKKAAYTGGWEKWSEEMHNYCIQDTSTTRDLFLMFEKKNVKPLVTEIELKLAWYLNAQERNGFPFDKDAAVRLYALLSHKRNALEVDLKKVFRSWWEPGEITVPKRSATMKKNEIAPRIITEGAYYQKIERVEFNPGSRTHIGLRLQSLYGWKPREFGKDGVPKVDEDTLRGLPYPEIPLICEYLEVAKTIGAIAEGKLSWLSLMDEHSLIHGHVNQSGAATHRATHNQPNMTQVPKVIRGPDKKILLMGSGGYGFECRSLFKCPPGWKIVGADVSGLELRGLGHFLHPFDGGAYIDIVTKGDVHTENMKAGAPFLCHREMAKTFVYAFIYGAGDAKLGSIVEPSSSEERQRKIGAELRATFVKKTPGMEQLLKKIKDAVKAGRPLGFPSGHSVMAKAQHSALNYLIQGTGAIICKLWIVRADEKFQKMGFKMADGPLWDTAHGMAADYSPLVWAHDETQTAVIDYNDQPETFRKVWLETIPEVGAELGIRCPLAGEAKIGNTWAETH